MAGSEAWTVSTLVLRVFSQFIISTAFQILCIKATSSKMNHNTTLNQIINNNRKNIKHLNMYVNIYSALCLRVVRSRTRSSLLKESVGWLRKPLRLADSTSGSWFSHFKNLAIKQYFEIALTYGSNRGVYHHLMTFQLTVGPS